MLIAIAGGVGTGKSYVADLFRAKGAKVISADEINRAMLKEPRYLRRLKEIFPDAVKDGVADKQAIRNLIFNDAHAREKLNALAHPAIRDRILEIYQKEGGTLFVEMPLLIGSGMQGMFDAVIAVVCSRALRAERVARRDGISAESAYKMIDAQQEEDAVSSIADELIVNDGDGYAVCKRVDELWKRYERSGHSAL